MFGVARAARARHALSLTRMESWFGGGILFAVAAVLWLAYLVPNWLQRREYVAAERNAVRLQQTIRVLAETAEAPEALRLENAAKARVVASKLSKQRVLEEARAAVDARQVAAARLRRTRLAVTSVMLVATVVLGWQAWLAATAGAVSGAIIAVGAVVLVAGVWLQRRIAVTARARAAKTAAAARELAEVAAAATAPPQAARTTRAAQPTQRAWTPQPLPQPLGQLRREAMLAAAREEALGKTAAAAAEDARIAALASSAPREAPRPTAPSRYASMGIIDDELVGATIDLDSALARRRVS